MNWKFGEHFFTTSKFKNGQGTIDHSNFLNAIEVKTIEEYCIYEPPMELNTNPSDEEIKNEFPINFAFYKIPFPSERYVYLHSKYTGRANHTPSRFGNFFSHSAILKEGEPSFPAVFFFRQFKFKEEFPIHEDEVFQPYLTEREIQIDTKNFSKVFNHFCDFLNKENNLLVFSKVLDLVVSGILTIRGNNITICADKSKVGEIILAINFFIPLHISNKISFATYVNNPTHYPFQITGIVPECSVTSLDPRYYTLINATLDFEYEAKQSYTKFLVDIIKENSDESFESWRKINKEFELLGITEPDQRLNVLISFNNFRKDVMQKTTQDFKDLLSLNPPLAKVQEIKEVIIEKNPQLYLDYVKEELKKLISNCFQFKDKITAFFKLYTEYFDPIDNFRRIYFPEFVESLRDELKDEEKYEASLHILLKANCTNIQQPNWIAKQIQEVEYWFESDNVNTESKIDAIKALTDKYNLKDYEQKIPNIMKAKSFNDMQIAAEKGNLFKSLDNYKNILKDLKDSQKQSVFVLALNNENVKGNFDPNTISKYIKIIKTNFEDEGEFWYGFFKNNKNPNPNNDYKKHSLEHIMKKFIVYNFMNEDNRPELFKKLLPLDEYSKRWIEEEIKESSKNESNLRAFHDYFNSSYEPEKSGWFSNLFGRKNDTNNNKENENIQKVLQLYGLDENVKKVISQHLETMYKIKLDNTGLQNFRTHFILPNGLNGARDLARLLSQIYYEEGLLSTNKFLSITKGNLVANIYGDTVSKTLKICTDTKGGVLFIEDAETLFNDSNDSLGKEAFSIILKAIETDKYDWCVIFSGCSLEMRNYLEKNTISKTQVNLI